MQTTLIHQGVSLLSRLEDAGTPLKAPLSKPSEEVKETQPNLEISRWCEDEGTERTPSPPISARGCALSWHLLDARDLQPSAQRRGTGRPGGGGEAVGPSAGVL